MAIHYLTPGMLQRVNNLRRSYDNLPDCTDLQVYRAWLEWIMSDDCMVAETFPAWVRDQIALEAQNG